MSNKLLTEKEVAPLLHYGKLGMHWGVRNEPKPSPGGRRLRDLSDAERQAIMDDEKSQRAKSATAYKNAKTDAEKTRIADKRDKEESDNQSIWEIDLEISPRMAKVISKVKPMLRTQVSDMWGPKATPEEAAAFWKGLAASYEEEARQKKR
jgi:hypothetical protein